MSFFILGAVFGFLFYLFLSAGSGSDVFYWSYSEIALGIIFSVLAGLFARRVLPRLGVRAGYKALNPARWALFIVYALGPFLFAMAKANLDVAYRVITGRIKPGIVKIDPKLKSDFSTALLANSITLTPGTLTVEVGKDRELYVHWINVKDKEPSVRQVCGGFAEWARRIAE